MNIETSAVSVEKNESDLRICYVGYNKSEEERKKSSSGGVFYLLAKHVLSKGGVVYGAAFDENFLVHHKGIASLGQLDEIVGSKYLQSRLGNSFSEIKAYLDSGRDVLFVGTACQIAGLKNFLRKPYKNLLTVDFICLGVPSPKVWKDYLDTFFKNESISKINFKDKKRGWHTFSLSIKSENKEFSEDGKQTYFFSGYFKGLYSRPCCSECEIKKQSCRVSDITLSDSWGCENFAYELDDNKGLSNIIVHSELGLRVFEEISDGLNYQKANFDELIENNKGYFDSKPFSEKRSQFWRDYNLLDKRKLFSKYCSSTYGMRKIYRDFKQRIKKMFLRDRKL